MLVQAVTGLAIFPICSFTCGNGSFHVLRPNELKESPKFLIAEIPGHLAFQKY